MGLLLAVLLSLPGGAFAPAERPPPDGFAHARLEEFPGSLLEADGTRLSRTRDGRVQTVGCTDPAGTGAIRDLALDPAGNTFVAAERGLFLLGPDVDALDPVKLGEGAPRGRPTSVLVDARRRVWIATEEAFGVLEPSFFWGRTIGAADGLDRAGPYRVARGANGEILLETSAGLLRYQPDLEPAPALTTVSLDDRPCTGEAAFRSIYGHPPRLAATGSANGGASIRWRIDRHHVWRSLEEERIDPALAPGAHVLEVLALDRDLDRSPARSVNLDVQAPRGYDPRILASAGALLALTFAGIGMFRGARRSGRAGAARGALGGAIAAALLGQIVAGLVPHAKAWPFVGFSMYTESHEEGSITYDEGLVGLDARGNRHWIDELSLGHDSDDRWQVLGSILAGGESVASEWLERWNRIHPEAELTGLQVTARRRRLTRDGPVPIAPLVFGSYGRGTPRAPR